jgi:hypothetical protein
LARKRVLELEHHGWITNQSGWEMTAAAALITAGLAYLKKTRVMLVLACKGVPIRGHVTGGSWSSGIGARHFGSILKTDPIFTAALM